jgi:hypothetical protein
VRLKREFLLRLRNELAGHAHLSLAGDLSRCRFADDLVSTRDQTQILRRNIVAPRQDCVVLGLSSESVAAIFIQAMAAGLRQAIIQLQMERDGVLELGAYDHFRPEGPWTGPKVSPALLEELERTKLLGDFRAAAARKSDL